MDKYKAHKKATTLRNIIIATLLTSGILITGLWWQRNIHEQTQRALVAKQSALAQKQQEVTELSQMVQQQKVQIRELSSRAGTIQSIESGPWMAYTASFYDGRHDGWGTGQITRSGAPVKSEWTIAVDPKQIPLGSLVEVKFPNGEDRIFRAEDTGGAIKGHHIDVYEPDLAKCFKDGRQQVMVRILVRGVNE